MLEALERNGVTYILIGGLAGNVLGSSAVTTDFDLCYEREDGNLERLVAALRELGATLRGAPEGVPFVLDARTLSMGDSFTFETDAGDLDILATPSGTGGFNDLTTRAVHDKLLGYDVAVASIDDLIKMKRVSGRRKDIEHIAILEALRDKLRERGEH